MNAFDILIGAGVALAVFFALRSLIRNRRSGGCGCGCSGCGGSCGKSPKSHSGK